MKEKTKTITAIATTINGQINYICGQSITEANKYVPRFTRDAQEAKEFTSPAGAELYQKNVSTQVHRIFTVITIDIIDKEPELKEPPKQIFSRLLCFLITTSIILCSCSQYTCPSINGGKEPRDKTKRMTVQYKQMKDGNYLVTERKGFNTTQYITDCKPCK